MNYREFISEKYKIPPLNYCGLIATLKMFDIKYGTEKAISMIPTFIEHLYGYDEKEFVKAMLDYDSNPCEENLRKAALSEEKIVNVIQMFVGKAIENEYGLICKIDEKKVIGNYFLLSLAHVSENYGHVEVVELSNIETYLQENDFYEVETMYYFINN